MSLSIEEQQEKRKDIYKMMKETTNIEEYRKLEKEYKKSVVVYITKKIKIKKNISK